MSAAVAHRGDCARHRENTLAAVASAVREGADAVEVDLRLTADGEVVVLHDATLSRLWGIDAEVAELSWAQVRAAGAGEVRIPLLREVLDHIDTSTTVLLDVLSADVAEAAVQVVRAGPAVRTAWCGPDEAMAAIRAHDPTAEIWMAWPVPYPPTVTDLTALRPAVVNAPDLVVGHAFVEAVHALGLRVSCWTVDDPDQMAWLASIGVDSVTTNRLQTLQEIRGPIGPPDAGAELRRARHVARQLAWWAGEVIRAGVGEVRTKANPADHVTDLDTTIEQGVRAVLGAQFPSHRVVGEEQGGVADGDGPCWYVDPVDGTANLANGVPWSSFSLALATGGVPVVAVVGEPWRGAVLEAVAGGGAWRDGVRVSLGAGAEETPDPLRGAVVSTELAGHRPWPGMWDFVGALADRFCTTRVMGSGTLTLAGVALGRGCGGVVHEFHPIDHLAATLIVSEAGGVVLDEQGREDLFPRAGGVLVARDARTARALLTAWRGSGKLGELVG